MVPTTCASSPAMAANASIIARARSLSPSSFAAIAAVFSMWRAVFSWALSEPFDDPTSTLQPLQKRPFGPYLAHRNSLVRALAVAADTSFDRAPCTFFDAPRPFLFRTRKAFLLREHAAGACLNLFTKSVTTAGTCALRTRRALAVAADTSEPPDESYSSPERCSARLAAHAARAADAAGQAAVAAVARLADADAAAPRCAASRRAAARRRAAPVVRRFFLGGSPSRPDSDDDDDDESSESSESSSDDDDDAGFAPLPLGGGSWIRGGRSPADEPEPPAVDARAASVPSVSEPFSLLFLILSAVAATSTAPTSSAESPSRRISPSPSP